MKKNGFSNSPNRYQFLTYIYIAVKITSIFVLHLELIEYKYKSISEITSIFLIIISPIVHVSCIIFTFMTTVINPSDPFLKKETKKKEDSIKNKSKYVLELNNEMDFCLICCSNIKSESKHCKACNRCVDGFDHHCIWVNNCVGKSNYNYFIYLIISFFIVSLINIIFLPIISINIFQQILDIEKDYISIKVKLIVSLSLLILDVIILVNMTYLILIHIYLKYKGISTYDYILLKRSKAENISNQSSNSREDNSQMRIRNENDEKINKSINTIYVTEKEKIKEMIKNIKDEKFKNKIYPEELIKRLEENDYIKIEDKIVVQDLNKIHPLIVNINSKNTNNKDLYYKESNIKEMNN